MLNTSQKELLLSAFSVVNYSDNQRIVNEGDAGDLFYIIKEGTVACTRLGSLLRNMTVGEYFGEQALLYGTPRTATIMSVGDVKCLVIGREQLTQALGSQLSQIIYRNSIRMSFDQSKVLRSISDFQFKSVLNFVKISSFDPETVVIKSGTSKNSALYIVLNGKLKDSKGNIVGEIFSILGEEEIANNISLPYDEIIAVGRVDLAMISKEEFNNTLGSNYDKIAANSEVLRVLKKVNLLRGLSEEKLKTLLGLLKVKEFFQNETIFEQGTMGEAFYIIKSGRVDVIQNDTVLRTINKLDYFGERSILFNPD